MIYHSYRCSPGLWSQRRFKVKISNLLFVSSEHSCIYYAVGYIRSLSRARTSKDQGRGMLNRKNGNERRWSCSYSSAQVYDYNNTRFWNLELGRLHDNLTYSHRIYFTNSSRSHLRIRMRFLSITLLNSDLLKLFQFQPNIGRIRRDERREAHCAQGKESPGGRTITEQVEIRVRSFPLFRCIISRWLYVRLRMYGYL